jgi:hypothetical protein
MGTMTMLESMLSTFPANDDTEWSEETVNRADSERGYVSSLSGAEMRAIAERFPPSQAWLDADEEQLF